MKAGVESGSGGWCFQEYLVHIYRLEADAVWSLLHASRQKSKTEGFDTLTINRRTPNSPVFVVKSFIMLVKNREDNTLIQVMNSEELIDPSKESIEGREKAGEEVQPTQNFSKSQLVFPSGESLPQCWLNPNYQA